MTDSGPTKEAYERVCVAYWDRVNAAKALEAQVAPLRQVITKMLCGDAGAREEAEHALSAPSRVPDAVLSMMDAVENADWQTLINSLIQDHGVDPMKIQSLYDLVHVSATLKAARRG